MALTPLKIKISSETLKRLIQNSIDNQIERKLPFLGSEPPSIIDETLTLDPHDFLGLIAHLSRDGAGELEAFRFRSMGVAEMAFRLEKSTKLSTRTTYSSLIEHIRETIPVGCAFDLV